VSSPGDSVTGTGPGIGLAAESALRLHDRPDPWLRMGPIVGMIFPLAGQPGHGRTAFVRRQPILIVDGRFESGYTEAFELICLGCGDNPYADYAGIPSRLRFSGFAGRSRSKRPWRRMTSTSCRFPARMAAAPEAEVLATRGQPGRGA